MERIGLQAVLELGSFSNGVSTYLKSVSSMSAQTTSAAGSISSSFVNLGSGVLKFGAIAGGAALAGVGALTAGLLLLGSTALTEFAKYERMSLSVQSLVARDLAQGQLVEQQRTVAISLTQKEAQELGGLADKIKDEELSRNTLKARIMEQSEALRQLRDAHGAEALDVQTATARLAELENEYNKSGAAIEEMKNRQVELTNKNGQLATVMEKVRTGQMDMNTAMQQAGPLAQELLGWISKLAIQSPFSEEGVNQAFQTALAYGFNIDEAKRLTQAEVDYAAATGKGIEVTNQIALALGQMQAKGKVSGQEIIQLTNAGVGVNKILEDMGFTLDDVSNGLVDSDKFINAVITDMEIFKGAGAAQANTFSGLISTLGDLKAIGLREFFTGTFTTIQPYLADFVGMLTSAALETGSIRALGDVLGTYVAAGIQKVVELAGQLGQLFSTFQTGGTSGLIAALGITPDAISLIDKFREMISQIATTIAGPFMTAFSDLSTGGLLDTINQGITFLNDHFAELQGALAGIAVVLAGGVFAAIVAGILSLLTPINLIIAGAALLGAAWGGNWFGIRDKTMEVWAAIQPVLSQLVTWLQTNIPIAVQTASDIWANTLQPALIQVGEWINTSLIPALSTMYDWLSTNIPTAVQTVTDTWNTNFLPGLQTAGEFITGTLVPALSTMWNWLSENIPPAIQSLSDLWTGTLLPALETGYENFSLMVELLTSLGELINAVLSKALEAVAGIFKNILLPALTKVASVLKDSLSPYFASIGATVKDDVSPVLKDLGEVIFPALQEGLDFVTQSIKDLIAYFNSLKDTVNSFSLPDVLTPGSPPPMAYALWDIGTGARDATRAISEMGRNMITSAGAAHDFIDSLDMGGIATALGGHGTAWMHGWRDILKNNITANMGNLAAGMTPEQILGQVGNVAAQWRLPPGMVTDLAEANGLVEHLTSTFAAFQQQMRIENLGNMIQMAGQFSSLGSTFSDMLQQQMGNTQEATKALDAYHKAITTANQKLSESQSKLEYENRDLGLLEQKLLDQQQSFDALSLEIAAATAEYGADSEEVARLVEKQQDLQLQIDRTALSVDQKRRKIAELTAAIQENSDAAAANAEALRQAQLDMATGTLGEQIAFLQDFLESGADSIRVIGEELGGVFAGTGVTSDVFWDRVSAQDELNRLLEEQRRQEELITRQKEAQQKLDFLKAQLDLIKLGRELGGNIFQGITFGLDASVEDLLAATNAVTMAMVDQINSDLQIGSPSRLMIDTFKQVMAGAAIGMERGQSLLSEAVRSIPIMNGLVSQPVFSQPALAGAGASYNYSAPIQISGVNINNGIDLQTFEERVERAVTRGLRK